MLKLKCGLAIGLGMLLISGACGLGAEKTAVRADEKTTQEPVKIDESTFPDEVFRQYVSDNLDGNKDGSLSEDEIYDIQSLNFSEMDILSFQGIEYFGNLVDINFSQIPANRIDLSKNTELRNLYCYDTSFADIDLSGCTKLTSVDIFSTNVKKLNLKNCSSLKWIQCYETQIKTLDLSDCVNLENLTLSICPVKHLDVSNNPMLRILDCNNADIRELDLSNNPYIYSISCIGNTSLKSLDINNCKYLTYLYCSDTQLSTLDLSGKEYIKVIDAPRCALNTVDVTGCIRLEELVISENPVTAVDFSTLTNLVYLECLETQITEVDISGLKDLEEFNGYDAPIKKFSAKGCSALTSIDLAWAEVKEFDISGCTLLQYFRVDGRLDEIDISECTELMVLYVRSLGLRSLDLSHNPKLQEIGCSGNDLLELDVSMLPDLEELCCDMNHLKELDLTHNPKLVNVTATNNQITSIDLSKNKNLLLADLGANPLKNLDISKNPELLSVTVGDTDLTSLDVSHNPKLQAIDCAYTVFEQLDIRKCPDMLDLIKKYTRHISEDGEYYYYSEFEEDSCASQERDPNMLIGVARRLAYPVKTRLIVDDQSLTPTVTPTVTPTETPTPTPTPVKNATIGDFVERLYTVALGRASEKSGKAFWVDQITSGKKTGGDCGLFFLTSEEFTNRKLSIEDFVETLYKTFFGRESEASGKAYWVGVLKNGGDRTAVIKGFIDSKEWCNLCADYGVRSGAPNAKAEKASKSATMFASRLYTCCLGREPEEKGLKYWALALTNLEQTGCSAAKQFFTGAEFVNLKLKNEEYVKRLYLTFMGRDPEASEITYWAGEISKGAQTRESVLAFFGQSDEFSKLCVKYGIERGSI